MYKGECVPVQTIKAKGRVKGIYALIYLGTNAGEWSTSLSGCLTPDAQTFWKNEKTLASTGNRFKLLFLHEIY
jgi:hypothetical protein